MSACKQIAALAARAPTGHPLRPLNLTQTTCHPPLLTRANGTLVEAADNGLTFTLMAERYERASMLITSNLVFSEWDRIFKNPMTTQAAIDRLVHHSVIPEFDVPSFRTEAAKARGAKTKKGAAETPRSEAGV